jgi:ABC-type glycerol-3-phosphate transport system permease component
MSRIATSSVPKLALVHAILLIACAISTFPIFRVVAISFRNTDTVSSMATHSFPPRGEATAGDYFKFITDAILPKDLIDAIRTKPSTDKAAEPAAPVEGAAAPAADDPFAELDQASAQQGERAWYSNYTDLFSRYLFLQWIYNSLIISISASLIGVFLAATAAYAFARFDFPGKRFASGFMFMTQMIPGPLMIIRDVGDHAAFLHHGAERLF